MYTCHVCEPGIYLQAVQPLRRIWQATRKRFECPHCGYVAHADVNAAFNIASGSLHSTSNESITEQEEIRAFLLSKKHMRSLAKAAARHEPVLPATQAPMLMKMAGRENLLAVLE